MHCARLKRKTHCTTHHVGHGHQCWSLDDESWIVRRVRQPLTANGNVSIGVSAEDRTKSIITTKKRFASSKKSKSGWKLNSGKTARSKILLQMLIIAQLLNIAQSSGLLDWLNLNPQPVRQPTITDFTSQGIGLVDYFAKSLRHNPVGPPPRAAQSRNSLINAFVLNDGQSHRQRGEYQVPASRALNIPIVPSVAEALPGIGACLPTGTPLVNAASPSLVQNFLRNVPLAQTVLRTFTPTPAIEQRYLMGTWHWVLVSASDVEHHCATSEYKGAAGGGTSATFSIIDKFVANSPYGQPKVGFGYGVNNGGRIAIYTQSDPCPYQVVNVGPRSRNGQYEYIILSNWAKYPVVGLVRDLRHYGLARKRMDAWLRANGYMSMLTDVFGSFVWRPWSDCRDRTSTGNIVGGILNKFLFGGPQHGNIF